MPNICKLKIPKCKTKDAHEFFTLHLNRSSLALCQLVVPKLSDVGTLLLSVGPLAHFSYSGE